jgi:regulator of protease activity HflC (stomatin/prohibitin superfamily)
MFYLIPGLYEVPQGHIAIVERFGLYDRILTPGLNWVNPFTSSIKDLSDWRGVATKCGYLMELTQQQLETAKSLCHTKDHVMVHATATIHFKIIDPKKALYEIDILPDSLKDVCSKALRSKIGSVAFDDLFSKRKEISQCVMEEIAAKVNAWGISLLGVEVGDLDFDPDIASAMKKRRIAEAEKEASLAKIEADSLSAIKMAQTEQEKHKIQAQTERMQAESEATTAAIRAQGQANAIQIETAAKVEAYKKTKEAEITHLAQMVKKLDKAGSIRILTAAQAVEGLKALSDNTNHKILMLPNDFKGILKLVENVS